MNGTQLLSVSQRLADISEILTAVLVDETTDAKGKNLAIALARQNVLLLQKDVLDHASKDLLKELDV